MLPKSIVIGEQAIHSLATRGQKPFGQHQNQNLWAKWKGEQALCKSHRLQ